jgi:hypothetical protein
MESAQLAMAYANLQASAVPIRQSGMAQGFARLQCKSAIFRYPQ